MHCSARSRLGISHRKLLTAVRPTARPKTQRDPKDQEKAPREEPSLSPTRAEIADQTKEKKEKTKEKQKPKHDRNPKDSQPPKNLPKAAGEPKPHQENPRTSPSSPSHQPARVHLVPDAGRGRPRSRHALEVLQHGVPDAGLPGRRPAGGGRDEPLRPGPRHVLVDLAQLDERAAGGDAQRHVLGDLSVAREAGRRLAAVVAARSGRRLLGDWRGSGGDGRALGSGGELAARRLAGGLLVGGGGDSGGEQAVEVRGLEGVGGVELPVEIVELAGGQVVGRSRDVVGRSREVGDRLGGLEEDVLGLRREECRQLVDDGLGALLGQDTRREGDVHVTAQSDLDVFGHGFGEDKEKIK